jgi:hypothetical protein
VPAPSYSVGIEFVAGSFTEVGSDCLSMSITRERADAFDGLAAGRATLIMDNADSRWSPDMRPSSPVVRGRQTSVDNDAGTTAKSVTLPAGIQAGDLLIVLIASGATIHPDPAGWTQIAGLAHTSSGTPDVTMDGFWRIADGSEGASLAITLMSASRSAHIALRVENAAAPSFSVVAGFSTTPDSANLIPSGGANRYLWISAAAINLSSTTPTVPADYGNLAAVAATTTPSLATVERLRDAASEDPGVWTYPSSSNWVALTIAVPPETFGSLYAPHVRPAKKLRVRATTDAGSLYHLFTGFIDSINVSPALGRRQATLGASDRMRKLDRRVLTVSSVRADINVGSVWTEVLSLLRVDTRSIDRLFDTLPFYWKENERGQAPLDELLAITHGYAYVSGDDVFHVKERYWPVRQTGPVGSYVNEALDLTYTLAEDQIINRATVRSRPRRKASTVQSVAWLDQVVFIPPSGAVSFELAYRDPVTQERDTPATEMATPLNGTDYLTNTSSAGDGTNLTAATSAQVTFKSVSAVCSVFNGDGRGAHLTRFVLRGKPLQRQPEVEAVTEDSSSQAVYDVREFTLANDLLGSIGFARDYSGFLVQERKEPLGDITLRLKNVFPDVLRTEIGDLLHVTESHAAVGSQWVVTGLTHTIRLERGLEHEVEYGLEFFRDPEWLILDDPVKGVLDSRRLGF